MLHKQGIKHERTLTYSLQMNGCAKRNNHILFEGMKTISVAANLPNRLWMAAVWPSIISEIGYCMQPLMLCILIGGMESNPA